MIARLRKLKALPRDQRRTLLASAALLPLVPPLVSVIGFSRLEAWLGRQPLRFPPTMASDHVVPLAGVVSLAARHTLGQPNCLARSMVLLWLLRRRGIASDLRIGVRIVGDRLDAHAWIELGGVLVNDDADVVSRYAAFAGAVSRSAFAAR